MDKRIDYLVDLINIINIQLSLRVTIWQEEEFLDKIS